MTFRAKYIWKLKTVVEAVAVKSVPSAETSHSSPETFVDYETSPDSTSACGEEMMTAVTVGWTLNHTSFD